MRNRCLAVVAAGLMLAACTPPAAPSPRDAESASPSPSLDPEMAAIVAAFPVPAGAVDVARDPLNGDLAAWETDLIGPAVADFYERALPAAGWTVLLFAPGDSVAAIQFGVPNGQRLEVDLVAVPGGTRISLRHPDP